MERNTKHPKSGEIQINVEIKGFNCKVKIDDINLFMINLTEAAKRPQTHCTLI